MAGQSRTEEGSPGGAGEGHFGEETVLRFVRGELSPAEVCAGIRHLLTGCPRCARVVREVWPQDNVSEHGVDEDG